MIVEHKPEVYCDMCKRNIDMGDSGKKSAINWKDFQVPVILSPTFIKFKNGSRITEKSAEIILCKNCALEVEKFINSYTLKDSEAKIKTFSIGTSNIDTING